MNTFRRTLSLLAFLIPVASMASAQNQALFLDGNASGVDVPGTASLDVQGAYTFEAWVRYEAGGHIVFRKDGFNTLTYQFAANSGDIQIGVNWTHGSQAGSWCQDVIAVPAAGPWTHVAASFDGASLSLYRNGVAVQSCVMPQPVSNAGIPLHIGWYNSAYGGTSYLKGWLDEVRIWNVARTAQEIAATINRTIDAAQAGSYPGLVACWNFEGDANDSTGVNNGAVFGGAAFLPATTIPVLDCDGNGVIDSIELGSGAALDCNANGVIDACDIAAGTSPDINGNGIPDECDPLPSTYCTAKVNSIACTPAIGWSGTPTASGPLDDFHVTASNVLNRKSGLMFWSTAPAAIPFGGGTLCVAPPIIRTPGQSSGGSPAPALDCSGQYSFHFGHAYIQSYFLSVGQTIRAQYWSRDPGFASPNNIGLTDALSFTLLP